MRLLLVEDDASLAEVVRRGLVAEGHAVEVASDGPTGLRAAGARVYDVIILDIMLPGLSGYRVLERLRQAEICTPVLMLTAKDGEYDEADAFDLGADDYLTKPFSFVVLLARLRSLLRRGGGESRALLQVGDLRLDVPRHRVFRGDVEITLTPREFGVLRHLMHNAGEVVTKTGLLAAVWDAHYEGDVNVVEIYVGYLRRKIDRPFGRVTIETVRGVGYRLGDGDCAVDSGTPSSS
ncbi:MAG: response regulator transcription factor [Pseudonocardia sp.]